MTWGHHVFAQPFQPPTEAKRPSFRISKRRLVEALIQDFVTEVEAHAARKRDWLKNLAFVNAERQFLPRMPDRADYDDAGAYYDAFQEFVRESLKGERPYPEPVTHPIVAACVGPDGAVDFEIFDDTKGTSA